MPLAEFFESRGRTVPARTALTFAVLLCLGTPVTAADGRNDCIVDPDGQQTEQNSEDTSNVTLSDCGGLLKPAPVGDRELVETPSEGGETPVISPEDIPLQPSEE